MSLYYVTHPNLSGSAKVDAPSTEKARTTFLDYLERQGMILRGDRHSWRRNLVAERMDDPSILADVELYYGYKEEPPPVRLTPSAQLPGMEQVETQPQVEEQLGEQVEQVGPVEEPVREVVSPIARVSLGGY